MEHRRRSAVRAAKAIHTIYAFKPRKHRCAICHESTGPFYWTCENHFRCCKPCLQTWGSVNKMRLMVPCPLPKCKDIQDPYCFFSNIDNFLEADRDHRKQLWTNHQPANLPGYCSCPHCGVPLEKIDGCDVIVCAVCSTESLYSALMTAL